MNEVDQKVFEVESYGVHEPKAKKPRLAQDTLF